MEEEAKKQIEEAVKANAELKSVVESLAAEVATLRKQLLEDPERAVAAPALPDRIGLAEMKAVWEAHLPENIPFNPKDFAYFFPKQFGDKPYVLEVGKAHASIKYL